MKKRINRTVLGVSLALLLVAATEGQFFSLVSAGIRTLTNQETSNLFDENRVHTLNAAGPFSVLAAGDIANCDVDGYFDQTTRNLQYAAGLERAEAIPNSGMLETARLLEAYPDAWVFALGDLVYKRGEPVGFEDCYDPHWGVARERTWPAPGNHEYQTPFAYGYYDYWKYRAGPDRKGYYALAAGNWLILSLNSETDASAGSHQAQWIETVIDAHPNDCVAAFYHKPAYSTVERRGSENAQEIFALLATRGVRFVLNGHNHFYERTQPLDAIGEPSEDGTVSFVAGAGGKTTSREKTPAAFADRIITGTAGVLKLDFFENSVAWTYLRGDGADENDSGTLSCR